MCISPPTCFMVFIAVIFALAAGTAADAQAHSSCLQIKDVTPNHVIIKDVHSPLILGVSERLTHRLTTEVFRIFLSEVLGYPDVRLLNMTVEKDSSETLEKFHYDQIHRNHGFMIDVEMFFPLHENLADLEYYEFKESGELGRPVRYGWFIPSAMLGSRGFNGVQRPYVEMPIVNYYTFKSIEQASTYALLEEDISSLAVEDTYEPLWCQNQKSCATLLSSSRNATRFVIEDINTMKLFVRVIWIENEAFLTTVNGLISLYSSSEDKMRSTKILMVLAHSLELLGIPGDFSAVGFPVCNHYVNRTVGCNYEGQKLMKVQWTELIYNAAAASKALSYLEFKPQDYQQLIAGYMVSNSTSRVTDSACSWMKSHRTEVMSWKPDVDTDLLLVGIFPLTRSVFAADGIFKGAQMAIEEIKTTNFLGNYKLNLLLEDGECKADVVMRTFIALVTQHFNKIVGILGPACSETVEPLAGVATHFETVVISYSAEGSTFSDRSKYPYFFRTIGENTQYQYVYRELFKKLGWKRVASISEGGTKYPEYIAETQELLKKDGVTFIENWKFSSAKEVDWSGHLQEFQALNAKIFIADVNEAAAKALMCEAYRKNMTAKHGFVWFLPAWLMPFWLEYNISHNATVDGRNVHCSYDEMLEAIDGHLSLSHAFFAADNETILTNRTVKEWRKEYEEKVKANNTGNKKGNSSDYAGYAYDAVWVYAKALKALMKENQTYMSNIHAHEVTQKYVGYIQNMNFSGVSGTIEFKGGSSRNNTRVNIYQWNSKTLKRVEVGLFDPKAPLEKRFILHSKAVRWLTEGGKVPWDGTSETTCVVDWLPKLLGTDCQTAMIIANVLGFGLLFILGIVGFLFIKHRYDQKVQLTQKYMKSLGIDLLSPSAMNGLDKWELPKEKVVINRKLGEGAFGMVYGGEASFPDKGWVAVAVKTLKVGSAAEAKLDFLSEAEVMKRFDHKNIVQLLGVCTKSEPVYTVMEFMLYGDLKTYLLARRHLVNDGSHDDNDEISSKKLTNMALDIARALSYLAELKYVHRDVACRNCLVNASRVVKLADFGMTRPMCDHDYYKFSRKGMLPVRWMAPESLALGVFSPASDIWSFGVLLYEIITFGNFPFPGKQNNEVLEYVKEGNTLTIPKGVKTNLETLIRSCWNIEYQKRPAAAEIVEFLANSPRIITPCLDVPLSSVPPMEDNSFGMPLSEGKTRKFSMTLRQRTSASPPNDVHSWTDVSEPLLPSSSGNWPLSSNAFSDDSIQDVVFPL